MTAFTAVIPARLASTRLPRKVLLEIGGKPMVRHAYERALASGAAEVIIATDDEEVAGVCAAFGADVQLTGRHHRSGTDRIAEVAALRRLPEDRIVVNVQADEPLLPPPLVRQAAEDLEAFPGAGLATLCTPITSRAEVFDPNVVKVVLDREGFALYFSRAPVPWPRDAFARDRATLPPGEWLRHIGLYGYRVAALRAFAALPPGRLEQLEALEQLRALEAGWRIAVALAPSPFPPGVDTPEDLARAERLHASMQAAHG